MVGAQFPPANGGTAPLPRIPAAPKRTGYLVKSLGLVAVAVVSGLVWWLIRHDDTAMPPPGTRAPAKEFTFAMAEGPEIFMELRRVPFAEWPPLLRDGD